MASSESTANAFELEYINEIKVKYANGDRNILHTPPPFLGGRPRLSTFYAKDVTNIQRFNFSQDDPFQYY